MIVVLLFRLGENFSGSGWHHGPFCRFMLALEIIHHLGHRHPLNTLVFVDMLNQPLMHEQGMRSTGHIWMDGHREDEFVILTIKIVEMVLVQVRIVDKQGQVERYSLATSLQHLANSPTHGYWVLSS